MQCVLGTLRFDIDGMHGAMLCRSVFLDMSGIDHQQIRTQALACEFGEDPSEHSRAAPTDKAVLDPLMRTIGARHITPGKPTLDRIDDTDNEPTVFNPWDYPREREIRLNPPHLHNTQQPDFR